MTTKDYNHISILVHIAMKVATRVAETRRLSLCN